MISSSAYAWIKALHVASVIAFTSGVLAQTLFVVTVKAGVSADVVRKFHGAERSLTITALFAALATGATIATVGGWFSAPWMMAKLVLVVLLLALHGYQSGLLRRMAAARAVKVRSMQYVVLGVVATIAILAVAKPYTQ
jgi:protoporphyrinogen IX oxidase